MWLDRKQAVACHKQAIRYCGATGTVLYDVQTSHSLLLLKYFDHVARYNIYITPGILKYITPGKKW